MTVTDPTAPPVLPQHLSALEYANVVRLSIADVRRGISVGALPLDLLFAGTADLEGDHADAFGRMTLFAVLTAARRIGPGRARTFCARHALPEAKLIRSLTDRQRRLLVDAVREHFPNNCATEAAPA